MPRLKDTGMLEPVERRVLLMHLAGAANSTIAQMLETSSPAIGEVLGRERVQRALVVMTGFMAERTEEVVKSLEEEIESKTARAFEVETTVMERLFDMEENVRAQLGAAATAQDILDRAGKRAPTKSVNLNAHVIDPQALQHLGNVLKELKSQSQQPAITLNPEAH